MDVDTDNFEDALAEIERHLPQAAFVAVDLEMTGISGPPHMRVSGGDVPQAQYTKSVAIASRYAIVQMGVCLFHEISPGQFECRPFNVFAFQRPYDERDSEGKPLKIDDHFVGLSASSMLFLAKNGLDFNRWINKGVTYVTADREQSLQKALPTEGAAGAPGGFQPEGKGGRDKPEATRPQDIAFIHDTMSQVTAFAATGEQEMKLPSTNGFLALILRQKISEKHPHLSVEKRPSSLNPKWEDRFVVNLSEEGKRDRNLIKRRRVLSHVGLRRLWNALKAQRRPVVVHNGFYDLLFLFSALERSLPPMLTDFKQQVHDAFPFLVDTKVLAESPELSGCLGTRSVLDQMSAGLDKILAAQTASPAEGASSGAPAGEADKGAGAPAGSATANDAEAAGVAAQGSGGQDQVKVSFTLPSGFEKYAKSSDCFHEAGFDAYETGRIFAYFRAKLGDPKTVEFMNRIYLNASAFQLSVAEQKDRLMYNGIARFLYDLDTSAVNSRGLAELLKPVTEEGKRKAQFKWCSDNRSLLLVVYGEQGQEDADREAVVLILDGLLQKQQEQGRLKFTTLEGHEEMLAAAAAAEGAKDGKGAGKGGEPEAKRQRVS